MSLLFRAPAAGTGQNLADEIARAQQGATTAVGAGRVESAGVWREGTVSVMIRRSRRDVMAVAR